MRSISGSADRDSLLAAYDEWAAAHEKIASLSHDVLTASEVADLMQRRERIVRRERAVDNALIARLAAEANPQELGGSSLRDVLSHRLRISRSEARRRIAEAEDLGPRRAFNGDPLEPKLTTTAAAQARGDIGAEHVTVIRKFFADVPMWVDDCTREQAEATLGRIAAELRPEELRAAADRLAILLDQDGEEPDDAERARRRSLIIGTQDRDGNAPIKGLLDPEARAALDVVLAKWAAPGMCNGEDKTPCVDGEAPEAVAERDTRAPAQRNHDALKAVCRAMLASGQLGQHNGLPATIVVTTSLRELESGCGWAATGGGTLLPMRDVIRLAAHSHHYLVVYKDHTEEPLYLGRTKRIASPGQRIVLYAKDRGCSRPGCTAPAYWCQVHHIDEWTADNGPTDITNETLACPPDHRLLDRGWRTRKRKDGRIEWIPPPHLDAGQARVNDFHHPQRYLKEPDDDEDDS